ncbi:MAG: WxcM-like domain-containing protein [Halobacteria archaeon]
MSEPRQVDIRCHVDDRGFLYQVFQEGQEFFSTVRRIYVVGNFGKGTIRGFHKHLKESKCYFVINGAAKFVVVSENGRIMSFVLSSRNPSLLVIPPGYEHGWVSLDENTTLIGLSDKTLEESLRDDYRSDPMKYGKDVWEVKPR